MTDIAHSSEIENWKALPFPSSCWHCSLSQVTQEEVRVLCSNTFRPLCVFTAPDRRAIELASISSRSDLLVLTCRGSPGLCLYQIDLWNDPPAAEATLIACRALPEQVSALYMTEKRYDASSGSLVAHNRSGRVKDVWHES